MHLNRWTTSEDRLATRADLAACTILPGPVPSVRGTRYVATLDIGIVNDRTVLTVMHLEETPAGRRVVLDRIEWFCRAAGRLPSIWVRSGTRCWR